VVGIPVSQVIAGSLFPYAVGQWFSFTTASSPIPVYTFEIANMYIVSVPSGNHDHIIMEDVLMGSYIDVKYRRSIASVCTFRSNIYQIFHRRRPQYRFRTPSTTTVRHFIEHDQVVYRGTFWAILVVSMAPVPHSVHTRFINNRLRQILGSHMPSRDHVRAATPGKVDYAEPFQIHVLRPTRYPSRSSAIALFGAHFCPYRPNRCRRDMLSSCYAR
jgi:hypothetical protein